jgi:UDP-N-acetylglucosamine--N-acetylmuramyl-(pentapeptide) pyrophosphoryl-undecaprenol N-acetylglucosamine transferase
MALAQELRRRGHVIHLMTDHRVSGYGGDFPAREVHVVPSATPSIGNPVKFVRAGFTILGGIGSAMRQLRKIRPQAVIGFGGYPVFPPFVAASLLGVPGLLHEQNTVMGRANRALARFADVLALSFAETRYADRFKIEKQVTGNPVRDTVRALAGTPYPAIHAGEALHLLVFGGSQGARVFADLVPPAIATLPAELRQRLSIAQQCRPEDLDRVADAYRQAKVNVELAAFFDDLPERLTRAHLVISRSGASTVADLAAIGRPAIMVPLPGSLDADQKNNALVLANAGGGWMLEQATVSPLSLGSRLTSLFGEPETLTQAAAAAATLGRPNAVEGLADLAERLAGKTN